MLNNSKLNIIIKTLVDVFLIYFSYLLSLIFIFDINWKKEYRSSALVILLIFVVISAAFKNNNKSWTYSSIRTILDLLLVIVVSGIIFFIFVNISGIQISLKVFISELFFAVVFTTSARYIYKHYAYFNSFTDRIKTTTTKTNRSLIFGAGMAGEQLARESLMNPDFKYKIIGFIDDNTRKLNLSILGYKVLGNRYDIPMLVDKYNISEVIIAIPSIRNNEFQEIYRICIQLSIEIKILPSFNDILQNTSFLNQIRNVQLEDLLGREVVEVNNNSINDLIENKIILVTGGAGSIGTELCRQIARHKPSVLICLDINENELYFNELELKRNFPEINLVNEICNIRESDKLDYIIEKYAPNIVFHAAAHKHVPLMEHNPEEAIKNNIFATKSLIDICDKYKVEKFVLISTDKAVNPSNVMGATKRATELLIQQKQLISSTKFVAVRFGNVIGSNGSVIPIFKKLISEGKNITITHPDITRYFMTIPEAAQLVLEAAFIGKGGDVFILDMGKPVKIMDLAKKMIELSGLVLGVDINIDIVGLRPGEKLYEELLYDVNSAIKTENKKIFIAYLKLENIDVDYHIEKLKQIIETHDYQQIRPVLKEFITTYNELDYD